MNWAFSSLLPKEASDRVLCLYIDICIPVYLGDYLLLYKRLHVFICIFVYIYICVHVSFVYMHAYVKKDRKRLGLCVYRCIHKDIKQQIDTSGRIYRDSGSQLMLGTAT